LRGSGILLIGIWFANGLLVTAHWLFLLGVARFTQTTLSKNWYLIFALWLGLLLLPDQPWWSKVMLVSNSLLITLLMLKAGWLLRPHGRSLSVGAVQLRYILLAHGMFYLAKAVTAVMPGTLIDLAAFRGEIIQISLVEGAMAIMLIALSMTGSERYRREKHIAWLAARDPLTGLYNRREFEARGQRLLDKVTDTRPAALLLMDIDHFKLVNDLYGHLAGDQLLITLSELIRSTLPDGSLAARLGGDEFVILLDDTSSERVLAWSTTLREAFQTSALHRFATPEAVTLSIGASLFSEAPASLAVLIERSDSALYESKRGGRNRLRLVDQRADDRSSLPTQ
jgi:diguanylate cyclase (GGDEF)-like protein